MTAAERARQWASDHWNELGPIDVQEIVSLLLSHEAAVREEHDKERLHWKQIHTGCHAERDEKDAQIAALREALDALHRVTGRLVRGYAGELRLSAAFDAAKEKTRAALYHTADAAHAFIARVREEERETCAKIAAQRFPRGGGPHVRERER